MADLALRVGAMEPEASALIRVAAVLLLGVFAVKAALIPLHFWLPASYAEAPAPVAALFAVMTKVGAYAIIRVYTLIFGPNTAVTGDMFGDWLVPAALITLVIGMAGVLGSVTLGRLAAFAAIGSMGTLLIAIGLFTPQATTAALYYSIHSTLAGALLFLVVDMVRERRAGGSDKIVPGAVLAQHGLVASMFFIAAIAMAGMPPLSGFIGKLLVLDAARGETLTWVIWTVILVTSLVAIVGFARAGSLIFWKTEALPDAAPSDVGRPALTFTAAGSLVACIVMMTLLAGPLTDFLSATSAQLFEPSIYIHAVLPMEQAQ